MKVTKDVTNLVSRSLRMMLCTCLLIASLSLSMSTASAQSASVKGFHVSGTTLYDATNKPFKIRGVNHAHTWYKNDLNAAIPAIAATGSNTVRIVLSNGQQWTKDDLAAVNSILALCDQYKLTAMLEVHDATGSDHAAALNNAVNYWISIKDALIGKEDRVIVNIANEWYGSWSSTAWSSGYQSAIPALRAAGIKNTLVVDAAGWGQYPNSIFQEGNNVFNSDPLRNTIFSIHMYEYSGGNEATVKSNIDSALAIGVPVIIGEFGQKHTNGDVDEATIMSYTEQKGVGWLSWSWYGNGGGVEYLDLATGPAGSLTAWGNTIVNGANGTLATSQLNGIYTTPGYLPIPDGSGTPTPTAPAAPAGLSAAPGDSKVALSWSASSGASSYIVKRSTSSTGAYTTLVSGLTATSYTDNTATNGTAYYYVVNAVNSAGTSANSNPVSATPQAASSNPSNLVIQYRAADTDAANNQMKPHFNIKNNGTTSVNLSDLKIRYYFTKEGTASVNRWIDWANIGAANISTSVGEVSGTNTDHYVELTFSSAAGSIAPGGQSGEIQLRVHKDDWSNWDEGNDYSYDPAKVSYADWNKVTLYRNGSLVWGIEP